MKIRSFSSSFHVLAPLEAVVEFHLQPENLGVLTPPPAVVRLQSAPSPLEEGALMTFTIWLGPFPVRWKAVIEQATPFGFKDRQLEGPFSFWVHTHSFLPCKPGKPGSLPGTEIHDRVDYALRSDLFNGLTGRLMAASLPLLFSYRAWKTRRCLR